MSEPAEEESQRRRFQPREARYNFGRVIDTARGEPVVVEKHGRPFVMILLVEEFERLNEINRQLKVSTGQPDARKTWRALEI